MIRRLWTIAPVTTLTLGVLMLGPAAAQHQHGDMAMPQTTPTTPAPGPPPHVTMEQLHANGGVPRGWKFTVPAGDPARGRQVFADFECYKCHTVKGETFPAAPAASGHTGPELTGMGAQHPAEYFAQSILDPNAVIVDGPGYTGPDGRSIMPSYADSLTLTQWTDVVAYLKSLTAGGDMAGMPHAMAPAARESVAGDYRVRLVYMAAGAPMSHDGMAGMSHEGMAGMGHDGMAGMGHDGIAGMGHGMSGMEHGAKPAGGRLMAFITDAQGGEAIPYLPVTAVIDAGGTARRVPLKPTLGGSGFHYGADVALPAGTKTIRVVIGKPALALMPALVGRFDKPVTAVFDWSVPAQ